MIELMKTVAKFMLRSALTELKARHSNPDVTSPLVGGLLTMASLRAEPLLSVVQLLQVSSTRQLMGSKPRQALR